MKYIHLFNTVSSFNEAYNGQDYEEPWVSYIRESEGINFNKKIRITGITFQNVSWEVDIPATGGTATKDNCDFSVIANYSDGTTEDITTDAVVTGSLVVTATTATTRESVGTLVLTATYETFTATTNVTAYQEGDSIENKYFTFNVLTGGTLKLSTEYSNVNFSYKLNDNEWVDNVTGQTLQVSDGDTIKFKASINGQWEAYDQKSIVKFWEDNQEGKPYVDAEGNIMSLVYGDNFTDQTSLASMNYIFSGLFYDGNIIHSHNLVLPATTLAEYCYYNMFGQNRHMLTAPEILPATTLAEYCYYYMFYACQSLLAAPELPALTLVTYCYSHMFECCSDLNYIKCLAIDNDWEYHGTYQWVYYAGDGAGTFVKNPNTEWSTGEDGVPSYWTVIDAD